MRYEVLTGLRHEQLQELSLRVLGRAGDVVRAGGRPAAIGLLGSVAMVVTLMRKKITQEVAGALFGVSQGVPALGPAPPAHRRCARRAGAPPAGDRQEGNAAGRWHRLPGLGLERDPRPVLRQGRVSGMNVQIAAAMSGDLAAVGPVPVRGARHDAHAFEASGLKDLIAGMDAAAGLGYTGVDGIAIVPFPTSPGGKLHDSKTAFNTGLSAIRAAVERAVPHLKTWATASAAAGAARSARPPQRSSSSCDLPAPSAARAPSGRRTAGSPAAETTRPPGSRPPGRQRWHAAR